MNSTDIIDLEALRRLYRAIGSDMDEFRDIYSSFIEDTPQIFADIEAGAASGDWRAVKRGAHSLKGAARDFGAREMAPLCAALEADAEQGEVADLAQRMASIASAFEGALQAIETLINANELI